MEKSFGRDHAEMATRPFWMNETRLTKGYGKEFQESRDVPDSKFSG